MTKTLEVQHPLESAEHWADFECVWEQVELGQGVWSSVGSVDERGDGLEQEPGENTE